MADKTLETLKTLLDGETYKAFKTRLNEVIERKVSARVAVIEEQKNEEAKAFKIKIQRKAEDYTAKKTRELETTFNKVLEESKKQQKTELTNALLLMESKLVERLDRVLEESVNVNTPVEILEEAAKARHYGKVANAVAKVIEEQNISVDRSGSARIKQLEQEVSQVQGKLLEEQNARVSAETRSETLQRELLLESKTAGLEEGDRKAILKQFRGSSYETIHDQIDNSIELLQESRKQLRRGRVAQQDTLVGDAPSTASFSGGKKLIEEEVKHSNKAPSARQEQEAVAMESPLFNSIDNLLP